MWLCACNIAFKARTLEHILDYILANFLVDKRASYELDIGLSGYKPASLGGTDIENKLLGLCL